MPEFCDDCDGIPVCDFCAHFFFGVDDSTYRGNGYCLHPRRPHKEDPEGGCLDFKCFRIDGKTELVGKFKSEMEKFSREGRLKYVGNKVLRRSD